jgi:hypothetical protein
LERLWWYKYGQITPRGSPGTLIRGLIGHPEKLFDRRTENMQRKTGHLISLGVLLIVISMVGSGLLTAAPQGCDPTKQEPADLSGTYSGTVSYPDGNLSGDATLTITGNQLTLESGGSTLSGRITAYKTCNYIGATQRIG